ncbi:phospholipase D-like domain-containing protein [Alkalibacterium kapii]|uniref:Phospholipase D family protein n=1 Tax=Alkalibacterium kapii TaxID=426704 RepID=A0A511ASJ6_9LACT|nr:phosphatidylserine/phosphatidylglycerophosphate/cardiolipin synthase family protein [Alkalibacterium kapii]GEK91175.1 phospholipase D family protein [Alkalibacterium kapii]
MLKKIIKGVTLGLGAYIGYAFFTGNILLHYKKPKNREKLNPKGLTDYYGDDEKYGPDKAAFFDTQDILMTLHLNLIDSAKQTIKLANFSIDDGKASDLFYGKLLKAADKGVNAYVLFDGKGHNLVGISNEKYWALMAHPNINLAFYEEFDWLRPWTWQNRMHDKYMIIDKRSVLTGGVNLEDAFFVKDDEDAVYDRNVVIINDDPKRYDESVLKDYTEYFESMWYHPFTSVRPSHILERYKDLAKESYENLTSAVIEAEENQEYGAGKKIKWDDHVYSTRKVSLVTNGIQRWKKDPHILATLGRLFDEAEECIVFQSPYVVPNKEMRNYISLKDTDADIFFVTNSMAVSTNFPAISGQRKYLQELSERTTQLYHFQGKGYIHAKAYMFDRRLSLIGSFNFDPRSSFLSQENLVIIDSSDLAEALEKSIKEIAKDSVPYQKDAGHLVEKTAENTPTPWYKKILLGIAYIVFYPLEDVV